MAVAIVVRRSFRFAWLQRRNRPVSAPPAARHATRPPVAQAANPDRWATLPGEYDRARISPPRPVTLALAYPGARAVIPCTPGGVAVVQIGGAWRGQVAFEGSEDGIVWRPVALLPFTEHIPATKARRPGCWRTPARQSPRFFRLHARHLLSGTVVASVTNLPALSERGPDALDHAA